MDLTRNVVYRGVTINDEDIQDTVTSARTSGSGIRGSVIDRADIGDVDVIQYREPKSQQDGMDAGEPSLGMRRVSLSGTLYAPTRLLLYDDLQALKSAFNARLAYLDEPADKGYQSMYFSVPTGETTDWPNGAKDLRMLLMPVRFRYTIARDAIGGTDDEFAGAIQWDATLIARDPRIYAQDYQSILFTANTSGTVTNRGDFPSPLNGIFYVNSAAGSIALDMGGALVGITIPASTGSRIIRYKGEDQILTVEEAGVETLRMNWMNLYQGPHPLMMPGDDSYAITKAGVTLSAGTGVWFWEAFA